MQMKKKVLELNNRVKPFVPEPIKFSPERKPAKVFNSSSQRLQLNSLKHKVKELEREIELKTEEIERLRERTGKNA